MHVGLLISEEILFSLAVLLFWDSFFLWNVKEENIFKLNEITWKKKGGKKKISLSTENMPNPFKLRKLLFSNIINVLTYFLESHRHYNFTLSHLL